MVSLSAIALATAEASDHEGLGSPRGNSDREANREVRRTEPPGVGESIPTGVPFDAFAVAALMLTCSWQAKGEMQ